MNLVNILYSSPLHYDVLYMRYQSNENSIYHRVKNELIRNLQIYCLHTHIKSAPAGGGGPPPPLHRWLWWLMVIGYCIVSSEISICWWKSLELMCTLTMKEWHKFRNGKMFPIIHHNVVWIVSNVVADALLLIQLAWSLRNIQATI